MNEDTVKQLVKQHLEFRFARSGIDFIVETGEIAVVRGHRADVVAYHDTQPPEPCFVVECKSHHDMRKAIGQALVHRRHGLYAGIAGVDVAKEYQDIVEQLPLHGFNVTFGQVEEYSTYWDVNNDEGPHEAHEHRHDEPSTIVDETKYELISRGVTDKETLSYLDMAINKLHGER